MNDRRSFLDQLKRRNVIRVAGLYLVGAWLAIQVASTMLPAFASPAWVLRAIIITLAVGFIPTLAFSWAFELTPQGIKREEDVPPNESITPQTARRIDRLIIAMLVLALAYFCFDRFVLLPRREAALAGKGFPNDSSRAIDAKSIAVLPFVNISADKNDEYLSDGMTEELLNVLARVPGLRVPGRTSCFAFKGKTEKNIFRQVGEQLHVGTVLEGSVRKAGDRLRVTAQLIKVSDGYHLWSKDYDGDVKNILDFQSNVAQQVVEALQVKLGGDEKRALAKKPTDNPEAYRLYLLGRYEFAKFTEAGWSNAMRYYEEALKLDPAYALAYCGLADNYAYMGSEVMPQREATAKEREYAEKALALDPGLAEAHISLGCAFCATYAWRDALKEFDRALELNPNLAFAYELQAWTVNGLGRFEEAITMDRKAIKLDPLNPFYQIALSFYLYWAGKYDEAIAEGRKTLEMDPNSPLAHVFLGMSLLKTGNSGDAIAQLQQAKTPNPGAWYQGYLGYAYAISGDLAQAHEALGGLQELAKRQYVSPTAIATIYLGLGEKEHCLEWLEKAYEQQDSACWYLKIDQIYDGIREEPRFKALVKEIGFDR